MTTDTTDHSSPYDDSLAAIQGLTWLPWVGSNYPNMSQGRRVLIVGESHYSYDDDPLVSKQKHQRDLNDRNFTRDVVQESLINEEWSTPTLRNMHELFYAPEERDVFWSELCFYNFVQALMTVENGAFTRPTWQDFWSGWGVFLSIVEILKPDHVLFIGVEAANHFNGFMEQGKHSHTTMQFPEKVGVAYARKASLEAGECTVPIDFIKHCGSYFSSERWLDYLHREARPLMTSIAASAGTKLPEPPISRLHVLGMAKSSLDLRGAKGPKLELDFLRLAYAIRDFREAGEDAVGYLMVLDSSVAETAMKWTEKYRTGEAVTVLVCQPSPVELELLVAEKTDNAMGFLPDPAIHDLERKLALADFGRNLGETFLAKAIEERHPGIIHSEDYPLGVNWDFYGTQTTGN